MNSGLLLKLYELRSYRASKVKFAAESAARQRSVVSGCAGWGPTMRMSELVVSVADRRGVGKRCGGVSVRRGVCDRYHIDFYEILWH